MSEQSDNPTPSIAQVLSLTQSLFLEAFRESGNIKYSCKVAGIHRSTYYDWRDRDEAFKAELPDATEDANDTLEFAAYDRAVRGVESYVVSMGRVVYEEEQARDKAGNPLLDKNDQPIMKRGKPIIERKYSDALLTTLLKARMPEKYKDKQQVDLNAQANPQDVQNLHDAIAKALAPFPDAKIAVAEALIAKERAE